METFDVFGYPVIKYHLDDLLTYSNDEIKNSINYVFSLEKINNIKDYNQRGVALSTCGYYEEFPLVDLPGAKNLIDWIRSKIINSSETFGSDKKQIEFGRTWINLMFEDCQGTCHNHIDAKSGVAIFYANAPKNSGDLVFVKDGITYKTLDNFDPKNCYHFKPASGDLIIHHPLLPHAVSKHQNSEPRICLVFEFGYI